MKTDDQMICEALGIPYEPWCCYSCSKSVTNPDFDTPEGMVTILREGPKQTQVWAGFIKRLMLKYGNRQMDSMWEKNETLMDATGLIYFLLTLTPPTLKAELVEFLKGEV